jgi:hypothetical protein
MVVWSELPFWLQDEGQIGREFWEWRILENAVARD